MIIPVGTQQQIPDDLSVYSSGSWSRYEGLTWCYVVDTIGARLGFDLFLWNPVTEHRALLASFEDNDGALLTRVLDVDDGTPELLVEQIMRRWLPKAHGPPAHVCEEMCARLDDWIRYWRARPASSAPQANGRHHTQ
jgi:hypothetical protein